MRGKESERDRQTDTECLNTSDREKEKKIERDGYSLTPPF